MDTVTCKHCSRNVVPRLWHEYSNYCDRATQHICPLCGEIMYITGGKLHFGSKFLLFIVGFMLFMTAIVLIREKFNPPPAKPPVACKGSAAQCKAAVLKQK